MLAVLLDETVQSVHGSGEGIQNLGSFKYLVSAMQNNGGSHQEVLVDWVGPCFFLTCSAGVAYVVSVPVPKDKDSDLSSFLCTVIHQTTNT